MGKRVSNKRGKQGARRYNRRFPAVRQAVRVEMASRLNVAEIDRRISVKPPNLFGRFLQKVQRVVNRLRGRRAS